jgi:hypothetical protein
VKKVVKPQFQRQRGLECADITLEQGSEMDDQQLQINTTMDPAFVPSTIVVKHFVSHQFTIEIGPSVISLGKPIRTLLIGAAVVYSVTSIIRSILQGQSVLRNRDTK